MDCQHWRAVDEVKVPYREIGLTQRTLGKIERSAEAFKGTTPFTCPS